MVVPRLEDEVIAGHVHWVVLGDDVEKIIEEEGHHHEGDVEDAERAGQVEHKDIVAQHQPIPVVHAGGHQQHQADHQTYRQTKVESLETRQHSLVIGGNSLQTFEVILNNLEIIERQQILGASTRKLQTRRLGPKLNLSTNFHNVQMNSFE